MIGWIHVFYSKLNPWKVKPKRYFSMGGGRTVRERVGVNSLFDASSLNSPQDQQSDIRRLTSAFFPQGKESREEGNTVLFSPPPFLPGTWEAGQEKGKEGEKNGPSAPSVAITIWNDSARLENWQRKDRSLLLISQIIGNVLASFPLGFLFCCWGSKRVGGAL